MIKNPRIKENRIPITPISFNREDIFSALVNISGEIFEKKSGEKGYILFKARSGLPRKLVNKKVKNVTRKREENME
jgi:hypothetical protein